MNNIPSNDGSKKRPNLISAEDISKSASAKNDDFFDDLNSTLIDDLDKSMEKAEQKKKEKKQKEVEKSNKIKSTIPIIVAAVAVVIVVVVGVIIFINVQKQANYTLNVIDSGVIVEQQAIFEDTSNKFLVDTSKKDDTTVESSSDLLKYNIVTLGESDKLNVGETVLIDVVVNTKESGEDTFSDHNTQLLLTYETTKIGYDNVIKDVEAYNEISTNQIMLPSKEQYDSSGLDLVLVEFKVSYPDNFPTYNSDGKVFVIPELKMEINGLCQELLADEKDLENSLDRYIVVNEFVYDLSDMISITEDKGDEVKKSSELSYKFITSLPFNTLKELYEFKLISTVDGKETVYSIGTINATVIENLEDVTKVSSENEMTTSETPSSSESETTAASESETTSTNERETTSSSEETSSESKNS